jgi:soluble lytic murein transglycosylase-like protein
MVRLMTLAALGLFAATDAQAQSVDWRRAGGDLFGASLETAGAGAAPTEATPVLADLDQPFGAAIDQAARAHGLDPKLLHALVLTESAYRPDARSPVGAAGLTQLMPATALELGVRDRFDPVENLRGGADYLARQVLKFGDLRLALAAYNAGPARVERLGRIPDIAETRAYVATVIECYLALSAGRGVRSSTQCRSAGGEP